MAMHRCLILATTLLTAGPLASQVRLGPLDHEGHVGLSQTPTQGVVTLLHSDRPTGPWIPQRNLYSFTSQTNTSLSLIGALGYFRAYTTDLTPVPPNGRPGFTNLTRVYGRLTTIAGSGLQRAGGLNNWRPEFEGAQAVNVELSRPHIAMADPSGHIYIADKEAHAIRKVRPDGTLVTVAGINTQGNGPDTPTVATNSALWDPNGLYVMPDGRVYIVDLGNSKIRRLDTNGMMTTVFTDYGYISAGRGLWVDPEEREIYYSSASAVKKWTPQTGPTILSSGFLELGNLHRHPLTGDIVATDRAGHRVWRIESDGGKAVIAGDGSTGDFVPWTDLDGGVANDTPLNEVRAVWFLPNGAYFLGTHRGSQVWYVDTAGYIHLFLNGLTSDTHAGDGTWFYNPYDYRVSEIRAITVDHEGNVLITEHDAGYVRKVDFFPWLED